MDPTLIPLISQIYSYLEIVSVVIAACAAIAAITPTKVDDKAVKNLGLIYNAISTIVNAAALNIGKAKNADAEIKQNGEKRE